MSLIKLVLIAASLTAAIGLATPAFANNLLANGGFETGDFTDWSANVETASSGNLFVVPNNGGTTPDSGMAYALNPAGEDFFALSDQTGPGSYSLTQSFTLSSTTTVQISFDFFVNNWATGPFNNGRDFSTSPNQNAEVDILTGGADPFTNSSADIVSTLWGPGGDPTASPNPWTTVTDTLSLAAGTYQIRFAETDNQGFFNMGVDNVSISTGVPEPSTWALLALGFAGISLASLRKRRPAASIA
jgi:PEP-CTERM motif